MSNLIKIAVVTGGNKGVGLEIIKGLVEKFDGTIYLTARNEKLGLKAVNELDREKVKFHQLDIDDNHSIQRFAQFITDKYSGIDLLVNNAAINYMHQDSLLPISEQVENTIRVNFTGTLNVCNALYPLLNKDSRVVQVSSRMGQLNVLKNESVKTRLSSDDLTINEICTIMETYVKAALEGKHDLTCPCPYSMSKVGLNSLTRIQQKLFDNDDRNISVNAVTPGFVATDMTKFKGTSTAKEGAETPLYLCFHEKDQPRGMFWGDMKPLEF